MSSIDSLLSGLDRHGFEVGQSQSRLVPLHFHSSPHTSPQPSWALLLFWVDPGEDRKLVTQLCYGYTGRSITICQQ